MDFKLIAFGLVFCIAALVIYAANRANRASSPAARQSTEIKPAPSLEDQLAHFNKAGIVLADGITAQTLLEDQSEAHFKEQPYQNLLWTLGVETDVQGDWRRVSHNVLALDTECIEDHGDYARIVTDLAALAGIHDQLTKLYDEVDIQAGHARLGYTLDMVTRDLSPKVEDDWLDIDTLTRIIMDIDAVTAPSFHIWYAEDGQALVLTGLTDDGAALINAAQPGLLRRFAP